MGDNQVRFVKSYLELEDELIAYRAKGDKTNEELIKAKMEGMEFGFNTYNRGSQYSFDSLVNQYHSYMAQTGDAFGTLNFQWEKNKRIANAIKKFLIENKLAIDVSIYFNGKRFNWTNPNNWNDEPMVTHNIKASDYFDYANDETVSMTFEGPLYHLLNYDGGELYDVFNRLLRDYEMYYEMGNAWNLALYKI